MAEEHRLVVARNSLGFTQKELGLKVAVLSGQRISDAHAQKKVSYWEGGQARPTPVEITALSEVLKRSETEIESWFVKLPSSAEDLFMQLAQAQLPSLIAACYSGAPAAARDPAVFAALTAGISKRVSLAMFFPFPEELSVQNSASTAGDLKQNYGTVWTSVRSHYEILFSTCDQQAREERLGLYIPTLSGHPANILIPPGSNRYTVIVQQTAPQSPPSRSLHVWVESERLEGLYRVGTFAHQDIYHPQLLAWQAYFGAVIEGWIRNEGVLPDSVPPWTRYRLAR